MRCHFSFLIPACTVYDVHSIHTIQLNRDRLSIGKRYCYLIYVVRHNEESATIMSIGTFPSLWDKLGVSTSLRGVTFAALRRSCNRVGFPPLGYPPRHRSQDRSKPPTHTTYPWGGMQ